MPVLTPTKDDGAVAKANEVVYVEPSITVTDEVLAARLEVTGLNTAFVADLLSACLTHERCGTHLYRSVATRTNNPILQRRYQDFGEETLRHVEILEALIVSSGGNPNYVSPMARAVEGQDSKLLEATFLASGGLDLMTAEMAMLDAVLLAETIDNANWTTLGQLATQLPDGDLRTAFEQAVTQVKAEEDEHLDWALDTKAKLTMLQAQSSMMAAAGAKMEEMIDRVRGWLS